MGRAANAADHDGGRFRKCVPDVPDDVPAAETVRKCFAFNPSERPNAAEMADALRPEAAELPEIVGGMAKEFSHELQRVTEKKQALQQEVTTTTPHGTNKTSTV